MSENDDMMYALYNEELLQKQWLEEKSDCEIYKLRRWEDPFPYGIHYRTKFAEEKKWYMSEDKRDQEFKKLMKERDNA
tara:strand:- start:266 stop:499 length:234 start_codon:yes stop_codon:yes gene_type:complete